ncbi:MFS transporter [Thermoflavimicrobium daqui]|nr:MFS transporter [Thermoflavimicrobium daqui]
MSIWKRNQSQLDQSAWLLLVVSGLYAISTSLSNMFVHVYLWKLKKDFVMIGWFNFAQYFAMAITFVFAGWLVKRVDRVISVRLGVGIQAIFYLTVLMLGTHSSEYATWLGIFLGVGTGFFWLGYNVIYFEITERDNRDIYNGMNGLFSSLAGMIAPFISGLIITRIDQLLGYRIIFAISLGIFVAAVIVSFFLDKRAAKGAFRLSLILEQARHRDHSWFWVNCAMIAHGLREGVFVFLIGLLVYITTKNELILGTYFTVSYLVSLLSFYVVGKWLPTHARNHAILIGAVMMGVVLIPFIWKGESWTMFVYGIGAALFYPLYYTPLTSMVFDLIGKDKEAVSLRVEYVVMRELALNIGRLVGLITFIIWVGISSDLNDMRWFILILGFSQVLTWLSIRRVPSVRISK